MQGLGHGRALGYGEWVVKMFSVAWAVGWCRQGHALNSLVALMCAGSNTGWTAEWVSIFNGKNLDGWTPKIKGQPAGKNPHNTFRVEDGLMKVGYKGYEQFDEQFGHIFVEKKYSHRIRLEYRFVEEQLKGGPGWAWRNSGIMLHCQDPKSTVIDRVSIEVQLLGGKETENAPANLCTPARTW